MTYAEQPSRSLGLVDAWRNLRNKLVASRRFQTLAQRAPGARTIARKDGEKLFDLIAGFTYTQTLAALTERNVIDTLSKGPASLGALAKVAGLPPDRTEILLKGGEAIGIIEYWKSGYGLSRLGAAFASAPGLADLVRHHKALYLDLADPSEVLAGDTETNLAQFWPYVFGAGAATDPATAARYSDLMAETQSLVAEDALTAVSLANIDKLLDVGGGTGAFLEAAGAKWPALKLALFDLPAVLPQASARFAKAGFANRTEIHAGDFRSALPDTGADAISLVRVLYDHEDSTVQQLLSRVFTALPSGGRLVVAEPMSGGDQPNRFGDVYFALYCLAMRTGRVRSSDRIAELLTEAGFTEIHAPRPQRAFVTSVITAKRL